MKSLYRFSLIAIVGLFVSGCQDPRQTPPVSELSHSAHSKQVSYAMPNASLERAIASTGSHGHH